MTDLNSVVLTGNITHDIGERNVQKVGETTKMTVSIAVNRSVKSNGEWKDEASFFDVVLWGRLADNLKPYLGKGKSIGVEGYLKQDRWEKEGKKGSKIYIVADSVKLLGGKADSAMPQKEQNELGFKEDIPYEEPEF